MEELLARTTDEADRRILWPELLLAASQGKVPKPGIQVLVPIVEHATQNWTDFERAPVELGLLLVKARS